MLTYLTKTIRESLTGPRPKAALIAGLLVTLGAVAPQAHAQYQVTTLASAVVENFNTLTLNTGANASNNSSNVVQFSGDLSTTTSAQRNSAWTVNTGNANFGRSGARGNFTTGTANSALGMYAAGNNTTTTDRAFAMQGGGNALTMSAVAQFQNVTGSTVTSILFDYIGEQWQTTTSRASFISVTYSTTSAAAALSGTSVNLNFNALFTTPNGTQNGDNAANRTDFSAVNLTGLNIANNSSVWFAFVYDRGATTGSAQMLAIDDVSVTFNGTPAPPASGNFWVGDNTTLGGSGTWAASGGTSWRSDNTDGTGGAFTANATANFGGTTSGTVTVSGTVAPEAGINFTTTGYTVTGGTINLAGGNVTANTITTNSSVTATIESTLTGSNGLTKAGAGTLNVSGANSYAGSTEIAAGVFQAQNSSALGATGSGNGTVVASGAALQLSGGVTIGAEALTLNGTGVSSGGALRNVSGNNIYGGAVTLGSASRINSDAGTLTLNSGTAISGAFGLTVGGAGNTVIDSNIASSVTTVTKDGVGIVTFNGASASTGATTISAGTLALGSSATLASTSISVASGATFDVAAKASGYALGSGVTLSGAGTVETASGQALTVDDGATITPGTTTTSATLNVDGGLDFASGGTYNFTLTSVGGSAGAASGWDLISITDALNISATSGDRFTFNINSSGSTGFSNLSNYSWLVATAGSITNFSADKFTFTNNIPSSNGSFSLSSDGTALTLNYAAGTALPIVWTNSGTADAWYTNTNWTPNTSSAAWLTTDVAQFNNTGTATQAGINMNTASLSIGAIEVTSLRTRGLTIGNSSTVAGGTLTLNGATVGSVANVILKNASDSALIVQNTAVTGDETMTVALGNTTNNVIVIDGAGNITISSQITGGADKPLTLTGVGSGNLTLSGANTYSGGTTISTGTLVAANASALGTGTVLIEGGTLATTVTNVNIGNNLNMSSGSFSLNGASTGTLTLAAGQDLLVGGGTWNLSIASLASFDSISGGGAGVFAIGGTSVLNLSGTIAQGSYNILTGFASGGGVGFSSITGLGVDQFASTSISGGTLTLVVVPEPHEYAIMIAGLLGVLIVMRRIRRNAVTA